MLKCRFSDFPAEALKAERAHVTSIASSYFLRGLEIFFTEKKKNFELPLHQSQKLC
jgi:hypothetical protein